MLASERPSTLGLRSLLGAAVGIAGLAGSATAQPADLAFDLTKIGLGGGAIALGDIDGDGDLDLATTDPGEDLALVLRNAGDGTFSDVAAYPVFLEPEGIVFVDLDSDLDLDFVTVNKGGDGTVSVYMNPGNGNYAPQPEEPVKQAGLAPIAIASGQLDFKASDDVMTANHAGANVSMLRSKDDGKFHYEVNTGTGAAKPSGVALGDIDGDGSLDCVVPMLGSNGLLAVLFNNDNAIFPTKDLYSPGLEPWGVDVGDLDGDDDMDVVTTNGNGNLVVFLNRGDGQLDPPLQFPAVSQPRDVALVDLDADLDLDAAVVGGDQLAVLLNDGAAEFTNVLTLVSGAGADEVTAGDLNDDQAMDLVVANHAEGSVSVFLSTTTPRCPGDFNGDGAANVLDFVAYQAAFIAGDSSADCNDDGELDVLDFVCFSGLVQDCL